MSTPVLILGTRTLAVDVMDLLTDMPDVEVAGFVENMNRDRCAAPLEGFPVHWIDDLPNLARHHVGVCALSTTQRRSFIDQATALGLQFQTLIHPTARVSRRAALAPGCFVSTLAAIATHTRLGRCVFVNRGALIGHHTTIGDYCTIQPGANVAGAITIADDVYVGMSAVILERKTVGAGSTIAAGAVVTHDVPAHVQVMGVPARVVKTAIEAK